LKRILALTSITMSAGLYFVLKYYSFTFTTHHTYSGTLIYRHNLFGPFDDVITEIDCLDCKR